MIQTNDLTGIDELVALRIIAVARSIAPCLDSLVDQPRAEAIAVLRGVADEVKQRGSRHIASQGVGTARIAYRDVASCFFDDDRAALRALCGVAAASGGPAGSFPRPGVVSRLWPEEPSYH